MSSYRDKSGYRECSLKLIVEIVNCLIIPNVTNWFLLLKAEMMRLGLEGRERKLAVTCLQETHTVIIKGWIERGENSSDGRWTKRCMSGISDKVKFKVKSTKQQKEKRYVKTNGQQVANNITKYIIQEWFKIQELDLQCT